MYTAALLQHIDTPDHPIEAMFKRVRNSVAAASGGRQTSWEHTSLSGEFYFNLSLGRLIDAYGDSAIADGIFAIDPAKGSHKIIAGLKSYDWFKQNPALDRLTAASSARMKTDNLFVIGRNIYQAGCGSSNAAIAFICDFMTATSGYDGPRRKAVLDGILFEIFFDPNGKLRGHIKKGLFNEVFELQRHDGLKPSFDFIAEALTAARGDFYALPGKGHDLAVSVSTKKDGDDLVVDAIYVNGVNVLRAGEDAWDTEDGQRFFSRIDPDRLGNELSGELVVPTRSLNITYTMPEAAKSDELKIPVAWTVRKA